MRVALVLAIIGPVASAWAAREVVILSAETASGDWRVGGGALQPELTPNPEQPGEHVIRLPYDFTEDVERAYWDIGIRTSLSGLGRFEVEVLVDKPEATSGMTVYFESRPGWYGAWLPAVAPEEGTGWQVLTWSRADMSLERPGPWSGISGLRISLWKAASAQGAILIRRLIGYSDDFVVVLPEWSASRGDPEAGSAARYAGRMLALMRKAGLDAAAVADSDLADGALSDAKLAVLPHVAMDPAAEEPLRGFMASGGKLLAVYVAPEYVMHSLGIRSTEWRRSSRPTDEFRDIRFATDALPGLPPTVRQDSWNATIPVELEPGTEVIGHWESALGSQGPPAVVLSANGAFIGHVLTDADSEAKADLLRAIAGYFFPEVWRQAYSSARVHATKVGRFTDLAQLGAYVREKGNAAALERLAAGISSIEAADRQAGAGDFVAACSSLREARTPLVEAFAIAQPAKPGEFRGIWCHSAFGVADWGWERSIAYLAECGFTAIVPNMLWGGVAYYPSEVLPVAPEASERGDQIEQCVAAAKRHGIEVHVWKVNHNLGPAPQEFVTRMRAEKRLQQGPDGSEILWLCPSDPANRRLEAEAMLEVVRNYDVDGIHFDYIRYPGPEGCYCDGCRERFETATGRAVANWPGDVVDRAGERRQEYLDFRRAQINALVELVHHEAKLLRPDIEISAAVWPNLTTDRDLVGQDWGYWIERGWLDFVCPMDYTDDLAGFRRLVTRQADWVGGRIPMYPGMGPSVYAEMGADQVLLQVAVAREHAQGLMFFNYDLHTAQSLLPMLRLGATSR